MRKVKIRVLQRFYARLKRIIVKKEKIRKANYYGKLDNGFSKSLFNDYWNYVEKVSRKDDRVIANLLINNNQEHLQILVYLQLYKSDFYLFKDLYKDYYDGVKSAKIRLWIG